METVKKSGLPDHYPVTCPHCGADAGLPAGVMTVANDPRALRLDFKCGECHHRWWQQFETPFNIAGPQTAAPAK